METAYGDEVRITGLSDEELGRLSSDLGLSLSLTEMKMLQSYFRNLGREPTMVEVQAMAQAWSEHCCYKSSKFYLKRYLSGLKSAYTILAMEDDAGVVEFDEEHAYVLKMESHNHPSAVEPYGGAATGVGGIIRDVLCMGAKPVALLDSLFLPMPGTEKGVLPDRYLISGIIAGIRDYGNRVGIPTVAGSIDFHPSYSSNPLVNAGCVGIMRKENLVRSRVDRPGLLLVLAGGRTGRDGIHGVNFASRKIEQDRENRTSVQLGNPIIKEPLIHACLEAVEAGIVAAMKDLGGGGLSSSVGEMCHAGGYSAEVYLDNVLLKESGMEPWEIWVSESQERMLLAVEEGNLGKLSEIFSSWDIEFSVIGRVKEGHNLVIWSRGRKVLDLDLNFLTSGPVYARHYLNPEKREKATVLAAEPKDLNAFCLDFIGSPNLCSREHVIRQYDHTVKGNTVVRPLTGQPNHETHSDAAVIKPLENSYRGLVLTSGSRPLMVSADPYMGTLNTVAEAYRNILAAGGRPHSLVDSLNFGDPEDPAIMGQFVESVRAIGDFCRRTGLPVVSGNVSLYNGSGHEGIIPTPTIMMVGIIGDVRKAWTPEFKEGGNPVYLIGEQSDDLGGSEFLRFTGQGPGGCPELDLDELERISEGMRSLDPAVIRACHDVSTGGIFSALCEMSFGNGIGVDCDLTPISGGRTVCKLFSEGGNRFIVEVDRSREEEFRSALPGVQKTRIGVTGGTRVRISDMGRVAVDLCIPDLYERWSTGIWGVV